MKKEFLIFKAFQKDWRMLSLASLISFGFVGTIHACDRAREEPSSENVDTLIPAGFVIIPIEVQNYESLDSLLGKYGVGDLFRGGPKNGQLVARNIRILRAPKNPSHFAVLAPESQATTILSHSGNFYVALKGPNQGGTQIVNPSKENHRVHFDGE